MALFHMAEIEVPPPPLPDGCVARRRDDVTITVELRGVDFVLGDMPESLDYRRDDEIRSVALDPDRESTRAILKELQKGNRLAWEALFWFDAAVSEGFIDAEDAYLGWNFREQRPRIELLFVVG